MTTRDRPSRRPRSVLITVAIVATACAGSGPPTDTQLTTGPSPPSILDESPHPDDAIRIDQLVPLEVENRSDATRTYTYPALGGIQVAVDDSHGIYAIGDRIMVDPIGSGTGSFRIGAAYLGLTTQTTDGTPIRTVEEFLDQLDSVEGLVAELNGQSVELFGRVLVGYTVDRTQAPTASASGASEDTAFSLFASTRLGAPVLHAWVPQIDELFLTDTPAGVLYAGYSTGGGRSEPVARPAFDTLVATAVLTGPGLDVALPPGSAPTATGAPPEPAVVGEDGPLPLRIAFGEIDVLGRYQLPNFGQPVTAELSGWRVQTNRPGRIVLTGRDSAGPGDSEVVFIGGLSPRLLPQAGGPAARGEPVDLTDIEAFLENPPPDLDISTVEQTTVGGLAATRFDAEVTDNAPCVQDDPCEFAFETTWDSTFTASIRAETAHRIWWISDHPTGAAMVLAADPDAAFLDRATELVESIDTLP